MSDQTPDDPIFGNTPDNDLSGQTSSGAQPPVPPGPPTPPAGMPPVAPPPPPAPGNGADVGAAFSWAIARMQESLGTWLGLAAAVVVINLVGSLVSRTLVAGATSTSSTGVAFTGLGLALVVSVLFGVLAALASIGVYRAALRRTQGVAPSFEQLTTTENLVPYVLVAIVYGLATIVGLALCILPGVAVIVLFLFAPYFALDKGQSVGDAFRNSFALVTGNLGQVVLVILVNVVANFLGSSSLLWGLLVLVTLPFSALFTAYAYRSLQGEQVAS